MPMHCHRGGSLVIGSRRNLVGVVLEASWAVSTSVGKGEKAREPRTLNNSMEINGFGAQRLRGRSLGSRWMPLVGFLETRESLSSLLGSLSGPLSPLGASWGPLGASRRPLGAAGSDS
eukprot:3771556-Pyramimonas_sp.AAC.1